MRQVKLQTPIADCLKLFLLTLLELLSVNDSYATKQFQMLNIFLPTLIRYFARQIFGLLMLLCRYATNVLLCTFAKFGDWFTYIS